MLIRFQTPWHFISIEITTKYIHKHKKNLIEEYSTHIQPKYDGFPTQAYRGVTVPTEFSVEDIYDFCKWVDFLYDFYKSDFEKIDKEVSAFKGYSLNCQRDIMQKWNNPVNMKKINDLRNLEYDEELVTGHSQDEINIKTNTKTKVSEEGKEKVNYKGFPIPENYSEEQVEGLKGYVDSHNSVHTENVDLVKLLLNNYDDRQKVILGLVNSGYKVRVEEVHSDRTDWSTDLMDYYIVVEE